MNSNEKPNRQRRTWLRVVTGAAVAAPLGMFVTKTSAIQNGPGSRGPEVSGLPERGQGLFRVRGVRAGQDAEGSWRVRSPSPVIPRSRLMAGASCGKQRNNFGNRDNSRGCRKAKLHSVEEEN